MPYNKGIQNDKVLKKVDLFHSGQPIACKHHGSHLEWRLHSSNNVQCKKCTAEIQKRRRKSNRISTMLRDAKHRKLEFDLEPSYIEELLDNQAGCCALTGVKFTDDTQPSLDRIDSSKGYLKGNVQLVLFNVNRMKTNLSQDEFIHICKQVAENFGGISNG